MPDILKRDLLPDYADPPVVETILGVQFDRLRDFKNAHLGAFWKKLDSGEWPAVEDVPPLPQQFEEFDKSARWSGGIKLQLTQDPSCRLQIKNQDGNRMIQLQNNRLHFNWLGDSGEPYPRYETVRDEFQDVLAILVEFIEQEGVGAFQPNQWEVSYLNNIPQGTVWKTPADWDFFRPLAGVVTIEDLVEGESFGGEWHFVIPDKTGRLHVQWQHGLKAAVEETEGEIVRLIFTARGPIEGSNDSARPLIDGLDLGRRTIVSSFKELMSDEANQYWGLKNASN